MYNTQLDTFIQVAEAGSFSKAAAALYITPTAVIKQINSLEARLGISLFVRSRRGLALTKAGESLLKDARHMVRYSQDAVRRAKASADDAQDAVVRIGVSHMTPTNALMALWPRIKPLCPGVTLQVVTFENTPDNARTILGNLGRGIDVVMGVFDERYLTERRVAAIALSQERLCCAVPTDWPVARKSILEPSDLEGRKLMMIRRGWNGAIDRLRDTLAANHPAIEVVDFPQYAADAYNQAMAEGAAITSIEPWKGAHPLMTTIPVNWDCTVSYGIFHNPRPASRITSFLDAVRMVVEEDETL